MKEGRSWRRKGIAGCVLCVVCVCMGMMSVPSGYKAIDSDERVKDSETPERVSERQRESEGETTGCPKWATGYKGGQSVHF